MDNRYIIISSNEIDINKWNDFVLEHPAGNFFQTHAVYNFYTDLPNYKPIILIAKKGELINGILLAVKIQEKGLKGYLSRRCIIWGGPLCYDTHVFKMLLQKLELLCARETIYIEFRNSFDTSKFCNVFKAENYVFEEWFNYIVQIQSKEVNKEQLNEGKRRQITKSLKVGAEISEPISIEEVKEFYEILRKLYDDKVKKPLPSFHFFEKFFLIKNLGKIFLVKYENKIIGGMVCPIFKDTIYEWYVCGLDRTIKNVYPSVLLTWTPIEYAAANKLAYFDFMGAGSPRNNSGVREFKRQFGGELVNYGRYIKVNRILLYHIGKIGLAILRWIK